MSNHHQICTFNTTTHGHPLCCIIESTQDERGLDSNGEKGQATLLDKDHLWNR